MLEEFTQVSQLRVVFGDCDMLRHVNNAAYIRWAETERANYFADVLNGEMTGSMGMILLRTEFMYERQIEYRERIAIGCRVSRIGTKSLVFTNEIWSTDHGHRSARGEFVCVAYDFIGNQSIAIPTIWRERIAAFEKMPPA